jgi:hypothetical protein
MAKYGQIGVVGMSADKTKLDEPPQLPPALRAYVPEGMLEFRDSDESSTFEGIHWSIPN